MNIYKFNAAFRNTLTNVNISFFIKVNASTQFEADKNGLMICFNHLNDTKNCILTYYKSEQDEQN